MNIVSVMAHQDDELMCLGTMLKMRKSGRSLAFICLTDGAAGMAHMPDMPFTEAAKIRDVEMKNLTSDIDAKYICLNRPDEYLYDTAELRLELIEAIRYTAADVIFTHNTVDYNADHMTACLLVRQCAMQAALPIQKTKSAPLAATPAVFMIEPSGGFEFEPSHWVDITDVMDEKMRLAKYHKSQDDAFIAAFGAGKGIDNWVAETSKKRGDQCGVKYAEAFLPMRARGLVKAYSVLP
ncbi:MAG: PIG-L family deacetylase [Oscillospiraceae bacterium]|nr:PIG-L family deacetylase [Oscillospiraceae bacterium]